MNPIHRHVLLACLFVSAACMPQGRASAQYYYNYNPYAAYAQAQYAQQMWNAQAMARAYYTNPGAYQNYYVNPAMAAATLPAQITSPVAGSPGSDPYGSSMGNPYANANSGYGVSQNSYMPPYYPPYGYGGGYAQSSGFHLMGVADVNRSYGSMLTSMEQARQMREQTMQARIDTRKKQFELEMYIKANTPSYNELQAQAAKEALKRIQTNSLPGEIASGRALNFLLKDLDKHKGKGTKTDPIQLIEAMLTRINVTSKTYGIGLLRNEGKLTWPVALKDILSVKERENLDTRIQQLVKDANKGALDDNVLIDVSKEIETLRAALVKKVNDVPTGQYLDAKRFLQEFDEAAIGLANGEAANQAKFQKFIDGGRSVQDVADYLLNQGLRIGPATAADEAAYRTVYSALATYDIAVNTTVAAGTKSD